MASRPQSTDGKTWTQKLDKHKVCEALEEATVDAHDEDEQHTGLLTTIEDALVFPFRDECSAGSLLSFPHAKTPLELPDARCMHLPKL
jgi:hypothetical protein